jgi:hypothetical protein
MPPTICYATGCNQKIDPNTAYYKMVAGAGGLDLERAQIGEFCSAECADRVPRPSDEAIARARAKLVARAGAKRRRRRQA